MDNSPMQYCECGCGQSVEKYADGRMRHFKKGHKSGIVYRGVNDPVKTVCGFCQTEITVERWRIDKFGICFCSRDHQKRYRSEQAIKKLTCENCGKVFEMPGSRKQGQHIFCSLVCSSEFRSKQPDTKQEVNCSGCGRILRVFPVNFKRNKNFYCSISCRARAIMGTNNPAFRSGWGRKREYSANWKSQRNAALVRDGHKCQHCGRIPKKSRYLHVHHIIPAYTFDGDWENANQLSNLITLCGTCHKKAEQGALAIQPKLL